MAALANDKMRRFAYAMACGGYSQSEAAREAGYSDHLGADRVAGHTLMHNAKVLDAIEEASLLVLRGLGPLAIHAAESILRNPNHRAHARLIETVLDRTGYAAKTEHSITVTHTADIKELEALARRLALENGIAPERFIGVNGLSADSRQGGTGDGRQKVIEGTVNGETARVDERPVAGNEGQVPGGKDGSGAARSDE